MFRILWEEKIISLCMFALFVFSMGTQFLLSIFYQNMINEAENMAATEHKILKQCKLKFSNCYQLNNGVANIPVFVDKFLSRLALGSCSFESLYHLSGQAMLLSVVCSGVGICNAIMDNRLLLDIMPYYIVSFLELYVYFSISTLLDVKGKRRTLKVNLIDYLENHLASRIGVTKKDIEMLYADADDKTDIDKGKYRNDRKKTIEFIPITNMIPGDCERTKEEDEKPLYEPRIIFTMEHEKELEALLKDFLTS